ncbi:MerC domain-containing protein, putative [Hepatocystis sp. ex Piliocolobus tephrosceles]|nr:MerC domain-containing protein, putative [Hepatocystis sp. ex Piliocolobus tephrosceles]
MSLVLHMIYYYFLSHLNGISSIASILCLIDCILIPVITVVLSFINVLSGAADSYYYSGHDNNHHHHHQDSLWNKILNKISLFLILPLFTFTTVYNYVSLKNIYLLLSGMLGIILFLLSHANINEKINEYHLPIEILGFSLLLGTNYFTRKLLKENNLDTCCERKQLMQKTKHDMHTDINTIQTNEQNSDTSAHENCYHKKNKNKNYKNAHKVKNENELLTFL